MGTPVKIFCTAIDPDGDTLSYRWISSGGLLAVNGMWAEWTAPSTPGQYTVQCTVSDGRGGESAAIDTLVVLLRTNDPPSIQRFNAVPRKLQLGGTSAITCMATDPDGDTLVYSWASISGSLSGAGASVVWRAPSVAGNYSVRCRVQDGYGGIASDSIGLEVRDLSIVQSGSLVAYYPFDGNANDGTGHGHDGTVNGAQLTNDRFGSATSAYAFNGTTASIVVPNDTGLNFQNSMTVNLWMKVTGFSAGREQYLISHGNWQNRWKLSLSPSTNKLRFTLKNTTGQVKDLDGETPLTRDTTYNVTCVYSGSELEIYVNGLLDAFLSFSGLMNPTATALTIGQSLPGDNNYNFNGILDDIRLYNYALSLQEIASLVFTAVQGEDPRTIPTEFALEQNYPNPFNPTTTITFAIPQTRTASPVSLDVYDVLGRSVATLVQDQLPGGVYRVRWEAGLLASGVYICQLHSGGTHLTQKMILMK
jgi:hypothetical protein